MHNRNSALAIAMAALVVPAAASATNGYQLIGIGAYQKSLAGAVTANPGHSAMTAVTNPAGSARVGARTDFSMEMFMPKRDVDFSAMGGEKQDSVVNMYGVPAIGWTAPVSDGSNVYFGGGMYGTSGMGVDYAQVQMMPGTYWDGYSSISFWQMAPTLAWNHSDTLSFGVSLNIDYQAAAFKQRMMDAGNNVISNFDLSRSASSFGLGLSVGVLYDVNDKVTVGASYKSKQEFAPLEYRLASGDITMFDGVNPPDQLDGGKYKLNLDFPQQLAAGLAWQASQNWLVSADIKWINWADTMKKLKVDGPGGNDVAMDPGWKDQMVYAVGISYLLNEHVNVRAGYNYAKAPFGKDEVARNFILPAITETHYTVGMDYHFNNHWDFAWHYMHAPKVTMKSNDPMAPGAKISLSETSFGINIGYRF